MAAFIFSTAVNVFLGAGLVFWLLYAAVVVPKLPTLPPSASSEPLLRSPIARWPRDGLRRYRQSLSVNELRRPHNWYLLNADAFMLISGGVAIVAGALMSVGR